MTLASRFPVATRAGTQFPEFRSKATYFEVFLGFTFFLEDRRTPARVLRD